ncbi:putative dehydrogenase [Actinacidiphila reveromycinica]|uniref:Putative dehydrogenase n=1 Tax=Actinacidiphila reveromycinica TaxID=659352 RepID=A0A7U3VLF7_9ACTN|nr:NAD(P)-dependent oxidoreductase [Streptomyces sp. SN-593]BBA95488.1 putative dehydrogenase [Streptomyces sp. SN-593]
MTRVLTTVQGFVTQCPGAVERLGAAGFDVVELPSADVDRRDDLADVAHVIATGDRWDAARLDRFPRLRLLHRFGTGYERIDLAAAAARGVTVSYAPGGNAPAVAEATVAMMITALRGLHEMASALDRGRWAPRAGGELSGRTVGLYGFGAVAQSVARLLSGFDVELLACTRTPVPALAGKLGVTLVRPDVLRARSDVLSLHLPAVPRAPALVDAAFLAGLRPGAVLVNTARGALIDEGALLAALESGRLAGAALDVFAREPAEPGDPLLSHPAVYALPHVGASSHETFTRNGRTAAEAVLAAAAGRTPRHPLAVPETQEAP